MKTTGQLQVSLSREDILLLRKIVTQYFYKSNEDEFEVIRILTAIDETLGTDRFENDGIIWVDEEYMKGVKGYKGA